MIKYNLKYYLNKDKKQIDGRYTIYLYIRGEGRTITINTKKKIEEKYWDIAKQKPKRHYIHELELNKFLITLKNKVEKIILQLSADDIGINYDNLKESILNSLENKPKNDFFKTFDDYIIHKETTNTRGTTKVYRTCFNHLKAFEEKTKFKIEFENINQHFFDKWNDYFIQIGNSNNYAKKMTVTLKSFLNYCVQREITSNTKYQNIEKIKTNETTHIALTFEELTKLESVELSNSLDKARDIFLFGLYTGQRYSDIANFNIMDVKDGFWTIRQQKTKQIVNVKLHDKAIRILSKYNYELPKLSNQKLNEYLKRIGELAKIDEPTKTIKVVGNKEITNILPKYELLCTHTARRTFVTMAKIKGIDGDIIKATTGHRTDKMVSQYFIGDNVNSENVFNQIFGS